jgi:hypothetical protein
MLYIGHFSFDEIGPEGGVRHGYLTTVVDAKNIENATNEFKELLLSMKKTENALKGIVDIYLEDIVEFHSVPGKAIISRIQSSEGEFPKSITHSLPGVTSPGINIYGLGPDVRANENEPDNDEYKETRTFIKFKKPK